MVAELADNQRKKQEKRRRKNIPCHDEDEEYRIRQRNFRATATVMLSSDLFHALILISARTKEPLTHRFRSMQKRAKEDNANKLRCANLNKTYFGNTMLSDLLTKGAQETLNELAALLTDDAFTDESRVGLL